MKSSISQSLSVLTQNTFFGHSLCSPRRMKAMATNILQRNPDVVFLQETLTTQFLKTLRNNYHTCCTKYNLGVARGGLVTFTRERPSDIKFIQFEQQAAFLTQQMTDWTIGKGVLITELKDGKAFVNTHLVSVYNANSQRQQEVLQAQYKQLIHIVRSLIQRGRKVIFGGDLNFNDASRMFSDLARHFYNMTHGLGENAHRPPEGQIDHIFACTDHTAQPQATQHANSDHPLIQTTIMITEEKKC